MKNRVNKSFYLEQQEPVQLSSIISDILKFARDKSFKEIYKPEHDLF
jgi:hypothetical protein